MWPRQNKRTVTKPLQSNERSHWRVLREMRTVSGSQARPPSGRTKLTPLGKRYSAAQLKTGSVVEMAFLVEVTLDCGAEPQCPLKTVFFRFC